eukprot:TRINITY_DN27214_c0_g1_i1.p1 TRINITY_DN27214_c0_g1~~TRINITY_DN27214_c0_g1_i1.p1  ORF type:complete len:125 (-),score=10.16 TRINITY_DN27214_c0_g1_i1:35-409(-)
MDHNCLRTARLRGTWVTLHKGGVARRVTAQHTRRSFAASGTVSCEWPSCTDQGATSTHQPSPLFSGPRRLHAHTPAQALGADSARPTRPLARAHPPPEGQGQGEIECRLAMLTNVERGASLADS